VKSRRDDFESLFYLLMYLLNRAKLPWSYLTNRNDRKKVNLSLDLYERLEFKEESYASILPASLKKHFLNALRLHFTEAPKY